ncbi:hypothetical protein WG915_02275 [Corynebacterium sp. H128]|uniref:hypothetical protein n=1 Tax=unclassified Corynebacterium TaxID=2624378 RepID=UPI0030AE14CD
MKFSTTAAAAAVLAAALSLTACSGDDASGSKTSTSSAAKSTSAKGAAPAQPSAADLNAVLAKATDPSASVEEKIVTVQGGDTAPELFETMTKSKAESGADFQVVDPILPGYTPDSVLATVNFSLPDREPQAADNVEFIYDGGTWKLSQSWACTLITNTVAPEQVPAMCKDQAATPTP